MRTRITRRSGSSISRALVALVMTLLAASSGRVPIRAQQPPAVGAGAPSGQSATLLPDGRWLLIGGEQARSAVQIRGIDGTLTMLNSSPLTPRAWHTATMLSDGSVLVVGGTDAHGNSLAAPERFIPGTEMFERLPADGFAPRAGHTATLLTDGRVLIVGGKAEGFRDDADVWDSAAGRAQPVGTRLEIARAGHTATLEADGRVSISGGTSADPARPLQDEIFDPTAGQFQTLRTTPIEPDTLYTTSVIPDDGATDAPVDTTVTLRFSQALDVRSVSKTTITLSGPDGAVPAALVPAECGRLVFVRPVDNLQPSAEYRINVTGVATSRNLTAVPANFSFTTKGVDGKADSPVEDRFWTPNGANGWRMNDGRSPWQNLSPLTAPSGVTALAGQVLRLDGRPLADVTLAVDGHETRSDRTGRFLLLLSAVPSGRHQLKIEGDSASRPGRTYGFFEAGLTIGAGRTNVVPYTIWMPRLDTTHTVRIASPTTTDTVVTTPFIPGLELHLPAGTVIKGEDGHIIRELGITPIPVDRPPFPLPRNVEVPIYFTIQPGGAYVYNINAAVPKGAQLIYPNYTHLATGVIANFWHYDPDVRDWYVYGWGTARGAQVFPQPTTRLYEFTGAMINGTGTPPAKPAGYGPRRGDPVDVSTGMLVLENTDLYLPDVLPLALHRTYRPADPAVRPFGIGATHDYAMFLWSANQYTEADLILPDGNRIHYLRTSAGVGYADAVFQHTSSPSAFYKSVITWNGSGWNLRLRDGTVYVFGENAPLQAIQDRYGNTLSIAHSNGQSGNVTQVTSPNGRWIAFTYDASNRVTQASDNIGRTVGYQYDAGGRLWKVTDAARGVTTYTYDASNRLLTVTDPRNITYLTNQYDANGRITVQTQADQSTYRFAYTLDGSGNVTQTDVTNPRGYVTRTAVNAAMYATSVVEAVGQPLQRTTTYTRDATSNRMASIVDPLTRETDYGYDVAGNVTSVTRLAGTVNAVTTSLTYEPSFNQIATVTDPIGHTTGFTHDTQGRLTTIADPLSHATTFTYNAAGQRLTKTNAVNATVTFGYDNGDLSSVVNALNRTTTRFSDTAGRVLRVIDPVGRQTQYAYDPLNRVTTITDPLGGRTTFTYDANSNMLSVTDALMHATTYTYDTSDRMATRIDPLTHQESYLYDGENHLTQSTDRKSQVTGRAYDALDRLAQVTFHDASTVTYMYDAGDRLTQIADSANGTVARSYDGLNRLTQETTAQGTVNYTYDSAGRRATMTVAGQSAVSYSYDNANRLMAITQGAATVSFTYDDANRRTSATFPSGIVGAYGYDAASHLTSLRYTLGQLTLGDLTYSYDGAGNRIGVGGSLAQSGLPAALGSATYDAANRVVTWGGTAFSFDLNGNLTADGTNTYTWDARDQLVGLSGGSSASFQYDGIGRRRSKMIGGTTTGFLYDRLNIVQEQSSGGTPTANLLTGQRIDETFVRTDAGGATALLVDALGSTRALAGSNGTIQTEYTYEPFGRAASTGSASGNSIGFTGREADGTGLLFYRRRYYDTRSQRFISEDPLGYGGGGNLFAYAGNSPAMFTDPLGLKPNPAFGAPPGAGGNGGAGSGGDGGDSGAGPMGTHAAGSAALSAADLAAEAAESAGARAGAAAFGALAEAALASEAAIDLLRIQEQHMQDINNACLQLGLSCGVPPLPPNPKR